MKRGFILFMVAMLILFVGTVIVIYSSIGSIITTAVEDHGSEITGTKVTLASADFTPSEGTGVLTGLKIGSPPPFKSEFSLSFDAVSFNLDIASLNGPVIVFKQVIIAAPEIVYEIRDGKDNLHRLKANIDKAVSSPTGDAGGKRILIENLYVEKGTLWVSAPNLEGNRQTAVLADIHLENIGAEENGLAPARLAQAIMAPLMREVTLAALETDLSLEDQATSLLKGLRDESEGAVTIFKKQGKAALEILKRETAKALENIDGESAEALENIKRESSGFFDWLNNLFGPDEEKQ